MKVKMKKSQPLKLKFPKALQKKLDKRKDEGSFRTLKISDLTLIDFSSNDYLGFSKKQSISEFAEDKLKEYSSELHGATGSRLLSGNYPLIKDFETYLAVQYDAESALVFNSGYDANLGLISSVAQPHDLILYDELSHASIRDGISLSPAHSYKFKHNDLKDLEAKLSKFQNQFDTIYVITEHVFSMDGDEVEVGAAIKVCETYGACFILDEAHAIGTLSNTGYKDYGNKIFARIITFGKSFGSHGAFILGSKNLQDYLINFAKSFIYTTAPSQDTIARNWAAHDHLRTEPQDFETLRSVICYFLGALKTHKLESYFIQSNSAIQSCVIGGNQKVKTISNQLQAEGFDVRAILSPTVPEGKERLRFCLHSYNTEAEIFKSLSQLSKLLN
jgi:8-amino-7-oxononanoate synthase